jgi:uncharacterized protein YcbX
MQIMSERSPEHSDQCISPRDIVMMLATVKQILLYPVKSMRGVAVEQAHLTLNGFVGDRRYAFVRQDLAATDGFPWLTGREKPKMILYAPRFVRAPTPDDWDVPIVVQTPEGQEWEIGDSRLRDELAALYGHAVFLFKTKRGNFDSQHVSLFSIHTLAQLQAESASPIEARQFRANLYIEPADAIPFVEDTWVGRVLKIGERARVGVTKKDSRCVMINLHPDTAQQNPAVLRTVVRRHDECAGIYANVVTPGLVRVGDTIEWQ